MKSGLTNGISSQLAGMWAHRPSLTVTESRAQAGGCAVPVGISMSICYLGGGGGRSKGSRNRDRDVSALHLRRNFATGALSLTHHSSHFGHAMYTYSCTACVSVWMTILVSVVCGQLRTHSITWATFPAITSSPGDQHTASPSPSHSPPLASLPGLPPAPLPSAASHQVLTLSLARTR